MEMKKRVAWVRVKSGILYQGLAILPGESGDTRELAMQDQPLYNTSPDIPQKTSSEHTGTDSDVGSVGNCPKLFSTNQEKTQEESFGSGPPLPTPDEPVQKALTPMGKPITAPFPESFADDVPTPPVVYEEFDL